MITLILVIVVSILILRQERAKARMRTCKGNMDSISIALSLDYHKSENPRTIRIRNNTVSFGKKVIIDLIIREEINIQEIFCPSSNKFKNFDSEYFDKLDEKGKIDYLNDIPFGYETWDLKWEFVNNLIKKGPIINIYDVWEKNKGNHYEDERFVIDWYGNFRSVKEEEFQKKMEKDKKKLIELLIDFNKKKKEKIRKKID